CSVMAITAARFFPPQCLGRAPDQVLSSALGFAGDRQAVKAFVEVGSGLGRLLILGTQGRQDIAFCLAADLTIYIPAQLVSLFSCPACGQQFDGQLGVVQLDAAELVNQERANDKCQLVIVG